MGGRQVGRSEPAFRVASTTALPPPTCTARRVAGQRRLRLLFAARPANCWLLFLRGLCRSDRPPAVFACSGPVLPALFACSPLPCHAHCPDHQFAPVQFCFAPLFISMCARIVVASCTDCPVGSYNTVLQWRPVRRFLTFDSFSFPAESIDPGPWFSVKFVRLSWSAPPGMSVIVPAMLFKLSE